jgi:tetratricopeptide (TPR) repeat protein
VTNGADLDYGQVDLAWGYYLHGYRFHWELTREANRDSRAMFTRATEIRPNFARAYGHLSYSHLIAWLYGWDATDDQVSLENVTLFANRATEIDSEDYDNWWSQGLAHSYSKRFGTVFGVYNQAIERARTQGAPPIGVAAINIDYADALYFAGEPEEESVHQAIDIAKEAIQVSHAPRREFHWTLGWAYYEAAYFGDAQANYERALQELSYIRRSDTLVTKNVIAVKVAMGQVAEARQIAERFLAANQGYTTDLEDRWPYRNPDRLKRFKDHLKEAGLT